MYANREGVFRSLKEAILIEGIVEVLEDLERGEKPTKKKQKLLKEGVKFLELAKKGRHYTYTRKLDEHAIESCSAYGKTLKALNRLCETSGEKVSEQPDIDSIFDESSKLLTKIATNEISEIPTEKLLFLQRFFRAIQETIAQEHKRVPETVLIKKGLL